MTIDVTGFVADLHGSESRVFEAAPVLDVDGQAKVAPGLSWSLATLLPVGRDRHGIVPLTTRPIQVGATVWVAGPTFTDVLEQHPYTRIPGTPFTTWADVGHGFRARTGSRQAFSEFVQQRRRRMEAVLKTDLRRPSVFSEKTAALFDAYQGLPVTADLDYQLMCALYFDTIRDDYQLAFTRAETVEYLGLLPSAEEFDRRLHEFTENVRRLRLSDARVSQPSSRSKKAVFRVGKTTRRHRKPPADTTAGRESHWIPVPGIFDHSDKTPAPRYKYVVIGAFSGEGTRLFESSQPLQATDYEDAQ